MRGVRSGFAVLGLVACTGGCGTIHLYDKAADDLATQAKDGYGKVKVAALLQDEQSNVDALEKKEIESFRKLLVATRDLAVLSLVVDGKDPFAARFNVAVDSRVIEIAGSSTDDARTRLADIQDAQADAAAKRKILEPMLRDQLGDFQIDTTKIELCVAANAATYGKKSDGTFTPADKVAAGALEAVHKAIDQDINWEGVKDSVRDGYAKYVQACQDVLASEVVYGTSGLIGAAAAESVESAAKLAKEEAAVQAAKQALKKAADAVASAQRAASAAGTAPVLSCPNAAGTTATKTGSDPSAAQKASSATAELCKALANLKGLGNLGLKAVSEEFVDKIDLTLAALSGAETTDDKKKLPPGLAFLSTSVRFTGALQAYLSAGKLPALEPLLIERQLATTRVGYATQLYELEKLRAALAAEKLDALLLELDLLLRAKAALGGLGSKARAAQFSDLIDEKCFPVEARCVRAATTTRKAPEGETTNFNEPAGRVAFRALAPYAESFTTARARYQAADLALVASQYRDALVTSESALASWDALIATPLAQLQAYYASGIKSQDIAEFLQAFGVIGIAARIK